MKEVELEEIRYPNHTKCLPRLNKLTGQLEGVKKMIENEKSCIEILFQLKAVRSAIKSLEAKILEDHIKNCVMQSFDSKEEKNKKIEELIEIFKKFDL